MSLIICTIFRRWNGNWKSAKETFSRNNQHAFSRCYTSDRSQFMVKYFMCPEMPKQGLCVYHKFSFVCFFCWKKKMLCVACVCMLLATVAVVVQCDSVPAPLISSSCTDSSRHFAYQNCYTEYHCYKSLLVPKQSCFSSQMLPRFSVV